MKLVVVTLMLLICTVCSQRYNLLKKLNNIARKAISILPDVPNESTELTFSFELIRILGFDYQKQTLQLTAWLNTQWNDSRFTWDPEEFGNINTVGFPCSKIPVPDLKLFNGGVDGLTEDKDINCIISSNGQVLRMPIVQFNSYCSADKGENILCNLKIGSWTYDCDKLQLKSGQAGLSDYITDIRWELKNLTQSLEVKHYACCLESYCNINVKVDIVDKYHPASWFSG